MRVLVTGATGFVGRSLVPALMRHGHTVRAATRIGAVDLFASGVEIARHGDLGGQVDWAPILADCDAVVHLAGVAHTGSHIPDDRYERVNRQATERLLMAAERCDARRFIFMSSIRAQSGPSADRALSEADVPRPVDAYGTSKLAAEGALRASTLRYTVLRPVLVYGPGVKGNLAAVARLAASPWPLPFAGLVHRRSLLHLGSLSEAVAFALDSPVTERETYVVADASPIALSEVVAALRHGLGRGPGLFAVPRGVLSAGLTVVRQKDMMSRLDGELIVDPSKLVAAGWTPTTDTAAALAALAPSMVP